MSETQGSSPRGPLRCLLARVRAGMSTWSESDFQSWWLHPWGQRAGPNLGVRGQDGSPADPWGLASSVVSPGQSQLPRMWTLRRTAGARLSGGVREATLRGGDPDLLGL